jgi:hypothetical protein
MPRKTAAPNNKSALTNDPTKLDDVDGRTSAGRRLRDLISSLTALVATDGKPLDDVVAAWIKLAAAGTLRGEQIAAAIGRGEVVKDEDLVRIQNAANRTMRELRDLKASRAADKGEANTLDHVSARVAAERAAEPDDDDDGEDGDPAWLNLSHEPVVQPAPEPVCTPSAPEPDAFVHEHVVPEPVKPQGPVAVWYDARPRSSAEQIEQPARTLHQVVGAIRALNVRNVRFTTPAVNYASIEVDGLIAEAGAVLADKCTWFVKGAA